jgi:hypothetical protein
MCTERSSPGVKWSELEANHSPQSNEEVENLWKAYYSVSCTYRSSLTLYIITGQFFLFLFVERRRESVIIYSEWWYEFPDLIFLFSLSWMQYSFVLFSKYLNSVTCLEDLLALVTVRTCPSFGCETRMYSLFTSISVPLSFLACKWNSVL